MRWLLVGAIAVVLVSIGLLARTIQASEEVRAVNRSEGRALHVSSVVILLLRLSNLSTVPLLLLLVLLMLAPVFYGFKTWLQLQGAEANAPT